MSRRPYPALLILAMTLPGAARALGLGDMRVDSALNEPLAAQIDILGATSAELDTLRARIADADVFRRYGADRPAYLSTVTFKVDVDAQGHAVLEIHSGAPIADPLVSFLVDIRWRRGELLRNYALLLDPASFAPLRRGAAVHEIPAVATLSATAPSVPADASLPVAAAAPVPPEAEAGQHAAAAPGGRVFASSYRVRAHDTLYSIVGRAGAGTGLERQRMMIAVYRANPQAFDGNINLLRSGALLSLPSAQDVARLDAAEARDEVADQMSAWRQRAAQAAMRPMLPSAPLLPAEGQRAAEPDRVADLNRRVQSLEAALSTIHQQLDSTNAAIQTLHQLAVLPPAAAGLPLAPAPPVTAMRPASGPDSVSTKAGMRSAMVGALSLGLGLLFLAIAGLRKRRPGAAVAPVQAQEADSPVGQEMATPAALHDEAATAAMPTGDDKGHAQEDTTVILSSDSDTVVLEEVDTQETALDILTGSGDLKRAQSTVLDYNLVDLDSRTTHVHMPSDLNDRPVLTERRKSIVDALQAAIARDPHRPDLRMKLLETYYTMAATNQRAFLEFAHRQARERNKLSDEDWRRIAAMGREMAPDDSLFADKDDEFLARSA